MYISSLFDSVDELQQFVKTVEDLTNTMANKSAASQPIEPEDTELVSTQPELPKSIGGVTLTPSMMQGIMVLSFVFHFL